MIELVFVIVILGILATVAIPKLAAARDDAKVSKEVMNLSRIIGDSGAHYTAKAAFAAADLANANLGMGCYSVVGTTDGNLTVTEVASTAESAIQTGASTAVCDAAHLLSRKQRMSDAIAVTYSFGGSNTAL